MAFPSDAPAATVGTATASVPPIATFALTQTVETLPQNQATILSQAVIANGHEQIVVEVRKRFDRATPGSGVWAEVTL